MRHVYRMVKRYLIRQKQTKRNKQVANAVLQTKKLQQFCKSIQKHTQNKNEKSGSSGRKSGENVDGCTLRNISYLFEHIESNLSMNRCVIRI